MGEVGGELGKFDISSTDKDLRPASNRWGMFWHSLPSIRLFRISVGCSQSPISRSEG